MTSSSGSQRVISTATVDLMFMPQYAEAVARLDQIPGINELGAIGEIVGALGVIASLIYLSVQIRQNTHAMDEGRRLALGGTPWINTGFAFVLPNGRCSRTQNGIHSDELTPAWSALLERLRRETTNAKWFLQIAHGGRQVSPEVVMEPVAPSAVPLADGGPKPRRVFYRGPSFANLQIMPILTRKHFVADVVGIIGSIDIVLGDSDR